MKTFISCFALTVACLWSPAAFACEPLNYYDWAVPPESGCVSFNAPQGQPGSPTIDVTNNCDVAVSVTPVDCTECDVELSLDPGNTGGFTVNGSVGSKETVMFTIGWASDDGANGTISGAVSIQEGVEDPCDDDAMCSTAMGATPRSPAWLLCLIGLVFGRRRYFRST